MGGRTSECLEEKMVKYEFWRDWKRKTKIEEAAIKSIRKAKKILFQYIPKDKIVAIYIKGSFVRREMTKKSDVDIVPIVNNNKYLSKIIKLEEKYGCLYKPSELLPHSLWELKNGKRYLKAKGPKGRPNIERIKEYKLIYGKPLNPEGYSSRSDKERLYGLIGAFKKVFLPLYQQKKLGFSDIVKQVFWLTDLEQRVKGKEPPHSWKKLAKSIKNKNHIVYDSLKYRLRPTKDKKERAKFILKLEKHLERIEGGNNGEAK